MSEDAPCGKCGKSVTYEDNGVGCEGICGQWYHITCIDMDFDFYMTLVCNERALWKCDDCMTRNFVNNRNVSGCNSSYNSSCSDSDSVNEQDYEIKFRQPVIKEEGSSPVSFPAVNNELEKPISDLLISVKKEKELLSETEEADQRKEKEIIKDLVPYISQKLKEDPDDSLDLLKECNIKKEIEEITIEEHAQFQEDTDFDLNDVVSCLQSGNSAANETRRLLVQDCDGSLPLLEQQDGVHLEAGELPLEKSDACCMDLSLNQTNNENIEVVKDASILGCQENLNQLPLKKSDSCHLDLSSKLLNCEVVENSSELMSQAEQLNIQSEFSLHFKIRKHIKYKNIDKPGKTYKCSTCNIYFEKLYRLKRHHKGVHLGLKRHPCKVCPNSFNSKYALAKHVLSKRDDVHANLHEASLLSDVRRYQCSYCNKDFKCNSDLTVHIRTHTGETPFACHLCNRRYRICFSLNAHLARHGIHIVNSKRQFECDICKKHFRSKESLQNHFKTRCLFKCNGCSKLFDNYLKFRRHVKICVSEWPFPCGTCTRGFSRKKSLLRHVRQHDPNFYYECEFCKKHFKRKIFLACHLQQMCARHFLN